MIKNSLYIITLLMVLSNHAQTMVKSSIDSGGASVEAGGIQMIYTIGEVNMHEFESSAMHVSEGFINASFRININAKVFLQGPLLNPIQASLMNDYLRSYGLLPSTSPYPDEASCAPSVFNITGSNAIVDWVWIELRAANDNTKIINARSALLQRDGDVVELDGSSTLTMAAPPANYYVVLSHRNHLGAMTPLPINISDAFITAVDFTNSGFNAYGSNAQVSLSSGVKALWAGNTNENTFIRFSGADNDSNAIKDYVLSDPSNGFNSVTFPSTGYLQVDVNMDGQAKFSGANNDSNPIKDNVLLHPANGFNSPTFTIQATVPTSN